jgi:5-methylcytosine-specific restriction endonuclease McrBC regulatory subunit McrC
MQYSQSNSPVYGILFDGAWLWEEYLATILCDTKLAEKQFLHPSNKTGEGGIKLFDNSQNDDDEIAFSKCYRRIYPDFYRKNQIILDAKYKHLENGFVRDDLYQIISYMHTMKILRGGFIFPISLTTSTNQSCEIEVKTFKLANDSGTVCTIAFPVPKNTENYKEFSVLMISQEKSLIQDLTKSF